MADEQRLNPEINIFAETNYRNERRRFGIRTDDRRRHVYIIGKTGMGKTTMMENMVISDIKNGKGLCVVDPHGDFADKMLDYIPKNRINDTIYFNPGDIDHPIAFNVMENNDPKYKHLIASGLVGVFKKIWADTWGPRLEYVLRNAILALLDYPGSTLLGIMRILVDKEFRKEVLTKITDPVVKQFWVEEYSKYPDRFMAEAIAPIQNKVGQFLSISLIRNIVGQVKSTVDFRDIIDNKKILIMNLAKGMIGEDASSLFGAMIITKLQLMAMSRVDMAEEKREDFYLYVDEFQNFATDSFADILSEARKYRLNLIMAHQYIDQLSEMVRYAVFGNVGTIIAFRIGATDSEFLVTEFEPIFEENDLVNLPKYNIYLKLMIDGVASNAFSASTLPPEWTEEGNREKVIQLSRERYTKDINEVEKKIAKWSGMEEGDIERKEREADMREQSREEKEKKKQFDNRAPRGKPQAKKPPQEMKQPFKNAFSKVFQQKQENLSKLQEQKKVRGERKPQQQDPQQNKPQQNNPQRRQQQPQNRPQQSNPQRNQQQRSQNKQNPRP